MALKDKPTRVVKCLNVPEFGEVLLDDGGVVLLEHAVQVLGYEGTEAGEGEGLVVEVEVEEGRAERVQPLPVDVLWVGRHPRLEPGFVPCRPEPGTR